MRGNVYVQAADAEERSRALVAPQPPLPMSLPDLNTAQTWFLLALIANAAAPLIYSRWLDALNKRDRLRRK